MNPEQIILFIAGCVVFLLGVALIFVKIDKKQLKESSHSNPGYALFRFDAYRYGVVAICFVVGLLLLALGLRA